MERGGVACGVFAVAGSCGQDFGSLLWFLVRRMCCVVQSDNLLYFVGRRVRILAVVCDDTQWESLLSSAACATG